MKKFREFKMCYLKMSTFQLKKARDYVSESTVLAVERLPQYFLWCCCFYCYRKRKSIGVVQENNCDSKGTPVIPITIAPEANKPHHQQLQQLYLPSNNIHQTQHDGVRQVEEAKQIEIHSKPPEQHQTSTSGSKTKPEIPTQFKQELFNRGGFIESSELSSEDSSRHSTPTQIMGEAVTPISIQSNLSRSSKQTLSDNSPNNSTPPKRTLSLDNVNFEVKLSTPSISPNSVKVHDQESASPEEQKEQIQQDIDDAESFVVKEDESIEVENKKSEVSATLNNDSKATENRIEKEIVQNSEVLTETAPILQIRLIENERIVENTIGGPFVTEDETDTSKNEAVLEPQSTSNIDLNAPSTEGIAHIVEIEVKDSMTEIDLDNLNELNQVISSAIPTMEVKPITRESTISKSSNSIFEPSIKPEVDTKSITSTEASSDYQPRHAASLDNALPKSDTNDFVQKKPGHIPLMRKSKTTLFGRNRRVSPVKQSIKLSKAELLPQSLTRFDKPKEAFNQMIAQLDSPNWETIILGLRSFVRLMRFHPDILDINMHLVCIQLARSAKNLRSQVARAACQAATELFTIRTKHLEQECDDLVGSLLQRTADTNRFLRADATRALEAMCDNLTPPKILHLLTTRGVTHQNAMVRTTTAKLLNRLASRMGCDRIFNMSRENRDKFIITGANLLLEGSLETRSYAKTLFRFLSSHHNYSSLLLEIIPSRTYRNIEKTLKNIN